MTELSERQILFRDFLINKLGFINDDFLLKYLNYLEIVSPRFRILAAQEKIRDEDSGEFKPKFENPYTTYIFPPWLVFSSTNHMNKKRSILLIYKTH